ncbi:MAG: hypothetical protein R2809_06185 [Flavobacteriales bacterium]
MTKHSIIAGLFIAFTAISNVSQAQVGALLKNKLDQKTSKDKSEGSNEKGKGSKTLVSQEEFWKAPTQNQQNTLKGFLANNPNLKAYEVLKAKSGKNYGKGFFYYEDYRAVINCDHAADADFTNGNKLEVCYNPSRKEVYTANHSTSSYFMGTAFLSEKYEDGTYLAKSYTSKLVAFDNFIVVFSSFSRNATSFTIERIEYIIADTGNAEYVENSIEAQELLTKINTMMSDYYVKMKSGVVAAAEQAEKEKYAKYGLKGKDVKSLAIEWDANNTYVLNQPIFFKVKATLANGTVISSNDGFWDDYVITVKGGINKGGSAIDLSIDTETLDPSDKVTVTVKSKHHPNVAAATIIHELNYAEGFTFSFNAYNGNSTANPKRSAGNVKVEVKAVKHAVTGVNLYEYRVYNNNKHIHTVRMTTDKVCIVNANGYNGAKPGFGDQYGSAGGSILIIKDPSAADAKFSTSVVGGSGMGVKSSDGSVQEKVQKVNW